MERLTVAPDVLFRGSVQFLDSKDFAFGIASGTAGDLACSAGMAGDDDAGNAFAGKYEPAARATVRAMGTAGQVLATVSARLLNMAWTYLKLEDAVAAGFNGGQIDVSSGQAKPESTGCEPSEAEAMLPQVTGAGETSGIPIIGKFWPQANPDRLRAAARVWDTAADLIDEAQRNAAGHAAPILAAGDSMGVAGFKEYCATVFTGTPSGAAQADSHAPLLESLSASCRALSKMCSAFADQVDSLRNTITGIAIGAGVITAAGIILTVFTLSLSDEAAAGADAALIAEASAAAGELATAASSSAEAAVVAEAEEIVAQAAGRISLEVVPPSAPPGIRAVPYPPQEAEAPTQPSATGPSAIESALNPAASPVGPIPPPNPPAFPLLTPAEQAAARQWVNGLPQRPANYGTPADRDYQRRVAGEPERQMSGANGDRVWADGYREADGAVIDAKNVRKQGCSPRTLQGLNENSFVTQRLLLGDQDELHRYQEAIDNPKNHAQYLELDTNDRETTGYWQFLCAENHVKSNVRYVP